MKLKLTVLTIFSVGEISIFQGSRLVFELGADPWWEIRGSIMAIFL